MFPPRPFDGRVISVLAPPTRRSPGVDRALSGSGAGVFSDPHGTAITANTYPAAELGTWLVPFGLQDLRRRVGDWPVLTGSLRRPAGWETGRSPSEALRCYCPGWREPRQYRQSWANQLGKGRCWGTAYRLADDIYGKAPRFGSPGITALWGRAHPGTCWPGQGPGVQVPRVGLAR